MFIFGGFMDIKNFKDQRADFAAGKILDVMLKDKLLLSCELALILPKISAIISGVFSSSCPGCVCDVDNGDNKLSDKI